MENYRDRMESSENTNDDVQVKSPDISSDENGKTRKKERRTFLSEIIDAILRLFDIM